MKRAFKDMRRRDPEDARAPALARSLKLPIWSNDRDLALPGVRCYPTAALLKRFDRV
jgi:predicted nucleic acid-binding protein